MQVVINIDDAIYKRTMVYKGEQFSDNDDLLGELITAVNNGTPLPKGHGDLTDKDTINLDEEDFYDGSDYVRAIEAVIDAPTIIEADRSKG